MMYETEEATAAPEMPYLGISSTLSTTVMISATKEIAVLSPGFPIPVMYAARTLVTLKIVIPGSKIRNGVTDPAKSFPKRWTIANGAMGSARAAAARVRANEAAAAFTDIIFECSCCAATVGSNTAAMDVDSSQRISTRFNAIKNSPTDAAPRKKLTMNAPRR